MATLRYVADDTMLNAATGVHEPVDPYWIAADDDGNSEVTGPDPLAAMAELAHDLELSLRAACDPDGPIAGAPPGSPLGHFLATWAELIIALPDAYSCTMTCMEANAAVELFRAYGREHVAEAILSAHAEHDQEGDEHYSPPAP